ncbi:MAG: biotin/lipoyl-containing protein [Candidatus Heimdallarchaeota archaeon]
MANSPPCGDSQYGITGDTMKKLVTTIDEIPEDIYISKESIRLKDTEFKIASLNGNYRIIDSEGNVTEIDDVIVLDNNIVRIEIKGYTIDVSIEDPLMSAAVGVAEVDLNIAAPLSGSVSRILIKEGQKVEVGEIVMIISAMKMENKIVAKSSGLVKFVNVHEGDQVTKGTILLEFEK